jgi:hypothetical protein
MRRLVLLSILSLSALPAFAAPPTNLSAQRAGIQSTHPITSISQAIREAQARGGPALLPALAGLWMMSTIPTVREALLIAPDGATRIKRICGSSGTQISWMEGAANLRPGALLNIVRQTPTGNFATIHFRISNQGHTLQEIPPYPTHRMLGHGRDPACRFLLSGQAISRTHTPAMFHLVAPTLQTSG